MKKEKQPQPNQEPAPLAYFFTICTYGHAKSLGCIVDGEMYISKLGSIVENTWKTIPEIWPGWQIQRTVEDVFRGRSLFFPMTPVGLDGRGESDLNLRTIAPYGLLEPLAWLLHMNGYPVLE